MIELPFPSADLGGNQRRDWYLIAPVIKKHREWARAATLAAQVKAPAGTGDIRVSMTFYPPDRRGDRVNFPNRCKPYWDGIADALNVNDRRFLPSYHFAEPVKDARVVVSIDDADTFQAFGDVAKRVVADVTEKMA